MPNYNACTFIGHLTRDWEVRQSQGGATFAKSGIAVNHKYKDKEDTLFLDCVAFGEQANVLNKYTGKGDAILLHGRLQLERWEKDGQKRSKHGLVVERFTFLGGKPEHRDDQGRRKEQTEEEIDYGDIPF